MFVVENEITAFGAGRHDGMAFAFFIRYNRDQQGACRPATLDKHTALEQHLIFAITLFVGIGPAFNFTIEFLIGNGLDDAVDEGIDGHQLVPAIW